MLPTCAFPFPSCAARVNKDFPVLRVLLSIGVGEMTVGVSSFWLSAAVFLPPTPSLAVPQCLAVAESHCWQRDSHSEFTFVYRRCLSTTLLHGWLFWSNIAFLHPVPFIGDFCILMQLRYSSREIMLFPFFVLFCRKLLLFISLLKGALFLEGMFTVASATVRSFPS